MLLKQMTNVRDSIIPGADDHAVPGGMFLASVAIGMAPAVAAVGVLSGAGLFALAGSGCLLVAGLITAVLSADS
jgi:hypothetical protein